MRIVAKQICEKCKREISKSNYDRHYNSCDGTYFIGPHKPRLKPKKTRDEVLAHMQKMRQAKNPIPWNKGLTKETNDSVKKQAETMKEGYKTGRITYTPIDPKILSENAKKQQFGGYRENAGRSKKFKYKDSFGREVCLQSTYELKCAEILDRMNIRWIRPKHLKYGEKRYFPDFYLVDYDLYLDPKNDFLAKKDESKIQQVQEQNEVRVVILTENIITEHFLGWLIGKAGS